jgi:hypothetical protein
MMDLSPILVAVFMGKTRWYTIEPGLQKPYCSGDINGLPHLTLKNTLKLYNWFRIPTSKTTHISDVMIWNSSATISVSSKGILLGSMRPRARKNGRYHWVSANIHLHVCCFNPIVFGYIHYLLLKSLCRIAIEFENSIYMRSWDLGYDSQILGSYGCSMYQILRVKARFDKTVCSFPMKLQSFWISLKNLLMNKLPNVAA